ncbi:hypothetical protein MGWOODY_Clf58 [hydrothermal vent metagenome]|uniref:Uncharacterized protein n=1 Tax=hydrothermal vent metagenome TaxID=652676 RepID=A0A160VGJ7_9ZZZZ
MTVIDSSCLAVSVLTGTPGVQTPWRVYSRLGLRGMVI